MIATKQDHQSTTNSSHEKRSDHDRTARLAMQNAHIVSIISLA